MPNFFQSIINKITGHKDEDTNQPASPVAPLDIAHVAQATAAVADPKAAAAVHQSEQEEIKKQVAAAAATPSAGEQIEQAIADALKKRQEEAAQAAKEIADAADQFEIIKEHTLTDDDTLSALALHFYGHATPEYWGLIILANKNTIGDKVSDYTPRKVIKIPKLPDSMKK